jgi:hypothetical protein
VCGGGGGGGGGCYIFTLKSSLGKLSCVCSSSSVQPARWNTCFVLRVHSRNTVQDLWFAFDLLEVHVAAREAAVLPVHQEPVAAQVLFHADDAVMRDHGSAALQMQSKGKDGSK